MQTTVPYKIINVFFIILVVLMMALIASPQFNHWFDIAVMTLIHWIAP